MGPSGALAGHKAPGVQDGGLAGVQGEGGLAKGACRPGASTPTGWCAGPGPAQPATAVLCRLFHLPGRPRPDAAALSRRQLRAPRGPAPPEPHPSPRGRLFWSAESHQDSGKGAGPRSRSQQVEEALSNPEPDQGHWATPGGPGPGGQPGASRGPGQPAALGGRGAGRGAQGAGACACLSKRRNSSLQPCSSSTAGDGTPRRPGPSAQLQLPEG